MRFVGEFHREPVNTLKIAAAVGGLHLGGPEAVCGVIMGENSGAWLPTLHPEERHRLLVVIARKMARISVWCMR